jgi:nucleotide-binding universal stress UspA family protein
VKTVIKRVLFATDLSDTARHAFSFAVALADRFESELVVVHVLKVDPAFNTEVVKMGLGEDLFKEMEQKRSQSARNVLIGKRTEAHTIGEQIHQMCCEAEQHLKRSKPLIVKDMVIQAASISDEILKVAEAESCDMIVIGHRKRHLLADGLGEGTLKKVLRQTNMPVVIVPAPKNKP